MTDLKINVRKNFKSLLKTSITKSTNEEIAEAAKTAFEQNIGILSIENVKQFREIFAVDIKSRGIKNCFTYLKDLKVKNPPAVKPIQVKYPPVAKVVKINKIVEPKKVVEPKPSKVVEPKIIKANNKNIFEVPKTFAELNELIEQKKGEGYTFINTRYNSIVKSFHQYSKERFIYCGKQVSAKGKVRNDVDFFYKNHQIFDGEVLNESATNDLKKLKTFAELEKAIEGKKVFNVKKKVFVEKICKQDVLICIETENGKKFRSYIYMLRNQFVFKKIATSPVTK